MRANKKAIAGLHKHCEKCFNANCRVPVELSVSCITITCGLNCGGNFHMCKEEEHRLLCPNESVACLNAGYGCPFTMRRCRLGQHLESCPASLVVCSLEWNRWPADESDAAFCKTVVASPHTGEQLDLALAIRDQRLLFKSLKMSSLFPELSEKAEAEVAGHEGELRADAAGSLGKPADSDLGGAAEQEFTQEEREALAKSRVVDGIGSYGAWECMFSKELSCCQEVEKKQGDRKKMLGHKEEGTTSRGRNVSEDGVEGNQESETAGNVDVTKSGLAPWQDGVLERLGKEVNVAEYDMYLVKHGSMLIQFGQLAACTPKERDFVYGNLEPVEVETACTFNVPTSFTAKRNQLRDPSTRVKRLDKAVDTLDLGVPLEELPKSDEIYAMLLCSLEKELRGHLISGAVATDGLFVDLGTQTYDFSSAPFGASTSLADVTSNRPPELHIQIQTEPVARRYNLASSAFTIQCGQAFRRDEFPWHFRNVHADIQSGLDGWFQQRCPLAHLGCAYSQGRLQPSSHRVTVAFDQDLSAFSLQPVVPASLLEGAGAGTPGTGLGSGLDPLSNLPVEILRRIARLLDGAALSQLSRVSQLMRNVCATLLKERGMVSLKWQKKTYSHGGSSWKSRAKVWQFSSQFSAVPQWTFDKDIPPMSEHLKVCPFYQIEGQKEPVALVSMSCDGLEAEEPRRLITELLWKK